MPSKPRSSLNAMQLELARQQENVARHDIRWRERWDSIACPFKKVQDLNSAEFQKERDAVLGPWRAAKAALAAAGNKSN